MKKFEIGIYVKGETNLYTLHTVEAKTETRAINLFKDAHKETIEDVLKYYPDRVIFIRTFDEMLPMIEAAEEKKYITGISEITEERWNDMLNCLPPQKWLTVDSVNIFRMMEYTTSNITAHYMRCGKRFFSAEYRDTIDYKEIARNVREFMNKNKALIEKVQECKNPSGLCTCSLGHSCKK